MSKWMVRALVGFMVVGLAGSAAAQDTGKPLDKPEKAEVQGANAASEPLDSAQVEKVRFLLSGYEYFPTREALEEASPQAQAILIQLAQDEEALPSLRTRALDALGLFGEDAQAGRFFEGFLHDGKAEARYLRHAMGASLKAFGPKALPWVEPYLEHQSVDLRLDAVFAVGRLGGAPGRELLLQRRPSLERDALVKEQLVKFVR